VPADDLIDLAFSKKRADDRKEWLRGFEPGTHVDYGVEEMLMSDFIHKELILFSMADNVRSIPSVVSHSSSHRRPGSITRPLPLRTPLYAHQPPSPCSLVLQVDGLKPAQRKVLFSAFKRNLKADIKVAQLAGYVSEHSAYHHGEAALAATIIGMAQDFVGSNNLALLVPSGQFGTRLMGGKDAASPRYIFTRLANVTRAVFHPADDALLKYLDDDGLSVEPTWYMPVIPMVLVNGADGIGTGWATSVPTYNPRDIIAALRRRIAGDEVGELTPWYRGFKGTVERKDAHHFTARGIAEVDAGGETLTVSELPVGRWTQDYKSMLVAYISGDSAKLKDDDDGAGGKGKGKGTKGKATKATAGKGKAAKVVATASGKAEVKVVKKRAPAKPKAEKAKPAGDDDEDMAPAAGGAGAAADDAPKASGHQEARQGG